LKAYVLIQTEANREPIAESLRGIVGVISAEDLSGPFDAIALAGSASTHSLTEQVVAEIQKIPGVIRALSAPLIGSIGAARAAEPGNRFVAA
jgi:AsnC-like helix-turn-helix protein